MSDEIRIKVAIDSQGATIGAAEIQAALQRLAQANQTLGGQAKLNAYQSAQLSNNLQDLFIQIQGGQAPMTALMQQGSQLSAVFGGVGNAARAVLSLITPLSVALGGAAAAIAGVAGAYIAGARESKAFADGIALTGNAAGLTEARFNIMATAIGERTKAGAGVARDALQALVDSGRLGSQALEATAGAASAMARATGGDSAKLAEQYAGMIDNVAEAAAKLNRQYNFLTPAQYASIKAMDDAGKSQEALAETMRLLEGRAATTVQNLGYLERGWLAVKDAVKGVWESMKELGRTETTEDKLRAVRATFKASARPSESQLKDAREQEAFLQEQLRLEQRGAEAAAKRAEQSRAEEGVQKLIEGSLDRQAKKTAEIALARAKFTAAGRGTGDPQLRAVIAGIEKKYEDKDADKALEHQARLLAELSGVTADYMKDLEALQAMRKRGLITEEQYNEAIRAVIEKQPGVRKMREEQERAFKAEFEQAMVAAQARRQESDEIDRLIAKRKTDADQTFDAITSRSNALDVEIAAMELTRTTNLSLASAIEYVTLARLRERLSVVREGDPEYLRLTREIAARERLLSLTGQQAQLQTSIDSLKAVDDYLDPSKAQTFGDALTAAFDGAGNAVVKLTGVLDNYSRKQSEINKLQQALADDKTISDEDRLKRENALISKQGELQIATYAAAAGAAKSFFAEGSRGYKAMEAAENVFRAVQIASNLAKGISAAAVGIANQAQGEPYTAIPRMAAMAAAMASLGFATGFFGSSGGGAPDVAARQAATGTGTVLGDASAKSESIAKSIDLLADTAKLELQTQSHMLASLRGIESAMSGLATMLARSAGITTGKNMGIREGVIAYNRGDPGLNALGISPIASERISQAVAGFFLGPVGVALVKPLQQLWGKTKQSVTDSGLSLRGTVADLAGGRGVQQYADVTTTKSSWFGLRKSSNTSTQFVDVEAEVAKQFGLVFQGIGNTLKDASKVLGRDSGEIGDAVAGFFVDITKLSLKDLKGADLQDALQAAIGAQADAIAKAVMPGLDAFQKVGEGYFETLVRVSSGIETANYQLEQLGIAAIGFGDIVDKQGSVATEIVRQSIVAYESLGGTVSSVGKIVATLDGSSDDLASTYRQLVGLRDSIRNVGGSGEELTITLIRAAGGVDALQGSLDTYLENYFTKAERTSAATARLAEAFDHLGIKTMPATRAEFRALVEAARDGTDAGDRLVAGLLKLAGAFADLVPAAGDAADAINSAGNRITSTSQLTQAVSAAKEANTMAQINSAFARQWAGGNLQFGLQGYVDKWWGGKGNVPGVTQGAIFNEFAKSYLGSDIGARFGAGGETLGGRDAGAWGSAGGQQSDLQQQQLSASKDLIASLDRLERTLADFGQSLLLGDLSILSPEEQYRTARAALDAVVSQGMAGDTAAIESFQGVAETLLRISQSYNASGAGYVADFKAVQAAIKALGGVMEQVEANTKAGVHVSAQGFAAVEGATREGTSTARRALDQARLAAQREVG